MAAVSVKRRNANASEDAILPMTDNYMQQILRREKTYEFRRYLISSTVKRIWFYINAPHSSLMYICEIDPARTRDDPLPEDGLRNREFNTRHEDWDRYDYAYRVKSVRKIVEPIGLKAMKERYGMKGAPRSLVYVPASMVKEILPEEQVLVWTLEDVTKSEESDNDAGEVVLGKREQAAGDSTPPAKRKKAC